MKERGSVFVMFLWVLILFTVFTMSVAFRTRLATRIRAGESKRFETQEYGFTAMNLARYFLENDETASEDTKLDAWYGEPEGFKEMPFAKNFAMTITDEESKLNLNKVTPDILVSVLEVLQRNGVHFDSEPEKLAGRVLAWRGESTHFRDSFKADELKAAAYESLEELLLVPGVTPDDARALRPFVTVYGHPTGDSLGLNINTADSSVLQGIIESFPGNEGIKRSFLRRIEEFREQSGEGEDPVAAFRAEDLTPDKFVERLGFERSTEMFTLTGFLLYHITVDSRTFMVKVFPRSEDGKSLENEPVLEAVIGPLSNRMKIEGAKEKSGVDKEAFSMIPGLEILAWHENFRHREARAE